MKCHLCNQETDFTCRDCEEPVCEDCCVQMTYENQIDYTLCTECNQTREAMTYDYNCKRWEAEKVIKDKKAAIAAKRLATAMKPENIEKRRLAKIQRKKDRDEFRRKQWNEATSIVNNMFRGMF